MDSTQWEPARVRSRELRCGRTRADDRLKMAIATDEKECARARRKGSFFADSTPFAERAATPRLISLLAASTRRRSSSAASWLAREPIAALSLGQLAVLGHLRQRRADDAGRDAREPRDLGRGHRRALLQRCENLGLVLAAWCRCAFGSAGARGPAWPPGSSWRRGSALASGWLGWLGRGYGLPASARQDCALKVLHGVAQARQLIVNRLVLGDLILDLLEARYDLLGDRTDIRTL